MSTNTRPSLDRHIDRVSLDILVECRSPYRLIHHRQSTDTLATVDRNISAKVSAECRPTYRPKVSTDGLLTKTTCRPTLDRHSTDTRPTYRPSVGRYIGRVSVAISADSIDRHSADRCLKYTWSVFTMLSYSSTEWCTLYLVCSPLQVWDLNLQLMNLK